MAIETPKELIAGSSGVFAVERIGENEVVLRLEAAASSALLEFFKQTAGGPAAGDRAGAFTFGVFGKPEPGKALSASVPQVIAGPAVVEGTHIPESIRAHVGHLGIAADVQQILEAARATYPDAEKVELTVLRDEYGDERVKVHVFVPEEGEEETEKYFACLRKWADVVPAEAAEKILFTTS